MPYYTFYEGDEELEEASEEAPEEGERDAEGSGRREVKSYEPAAGDFDPEDMEDVGRLAYELLVGIGARIVRCSYDGGGDEGFAHFEEAVFGDVHDADRLDVRSMAERLADTPLGDLPAAPWIFPPDFFKGLTRVERAKEALDQFAFLLAERLLGEGYGTGDYSMHGSFTVFMDTREIADEEKVW